jgi:hypothetical protein
MDTDKIRRCSTLLEPPAPQVVCELCDEIERLRAQPSPFVVKLPPRKLSDSCLDYTEAMRGYNQGLDACADAIRAAGGTVEGEPCFSAASYGDIICENGMSLYRVPKP